jgi:predicted negative regulator of RcsB-dependent stress response
MAYDLEEQEQIARLKSWWAQSRVMIFIVLAAALATVAAVQGWRYYQHGQTTAASTLFQQLEQAGFAKDYKRLRDIAAQIESRYGGTAYASLAAFSAAHACVESGELAEARTHLKWVLDHAKQEEFLHLARLRLAALLLDEKNHAEALALLDGKPAESFAGLYADLRGDILHAQGKPAEARAAYQLAFDKSDAQSPYRAILQAKLDALGDAK